jgi:outer membrane autotransporter protein
LTISGNYVQNSRGTLSIQVAGTAPGQFGLLAISGHATLGGTLQIVPINGFQLAVGNKLTFLTATGGVSGNFSTIQNPFPTSVLAQLVLLPDAVEIEATQGSFVSILQSLGSIVTPNELAVAKALDSARGDPREAALFAFLNSQPIANLPHDLSLIAPTQISSINASVSIGKVQTSNIGQRMLNIHAGSTGFSSSGFTLNGEAPAFGNGLAGETGAEGKSGPSVLAPIPENRWGFFVTGLGEFTNVDSTPNANGYDVNTGGITLGVDYRVTPYFAVGLLGGYAHNNVSLVGGGNIDVNGGTFGAYATLFGNGFYLDAAVTGGPSGYDTHRTALQGSAGGSTEGADLNVVVSAGYDWKYGNFSIGPTASFEYGYVGLDGFSETGSLAPLRFPDQNTESEITTFGAKATYEWKVGKITLIPQVSAGWQHEYGSVAYQVVAGFASGAGSSFTVNGPGIGRDSLLIGAGVSMIWSDRISTYVFYDGDVARTNYDSHTVTGGFRITF